ncbi:hypothetical protein HZQ75_02055 [Elizabethkingia anophelis]|uniref:Fibrobacter succinogenes major paralogous domain-containing protein n=1 Tax=Elizabethkingia anophelis R26 TaxID=1246994 RepID=A0ABM6MRS2_9FLAO|nr:FISUMP domain-containing protein [Elizabethkingia anophelis]ATC35809.1 hypothetical protein BAZ09_006080 [Elizabethkingia anophelis R26]ATC39447.1 hypothetical protein EAAG1_006080 [Elizabethkingia anophelis Ag1]ATC43126.1 hypothetical protein CMV41_06080 [Elizabethkingia anophelis]ATC46802.1 hypothetical protein CMV40_06080 [Elizabethkingia anophelis]ELR81168.1 hypothetical protein D505_00710 [Elizabethkingia anophelis R26]
MKRNINKNIKHISFSIAILSNLFYISSCRSADIDQDKVLNGSERSGGLAAVNINLLGSEYANSDKPAQVASINQKGLNVDNDIQHYNVLVSPSSFITAELTPNRSLSSVASSKNLNAIAAVTGDQLGAGNKFRVIVYKHNDGSYKTYQDYTIGQPVSPLMLDGGVDYDIVVYSYGVNTLPAISSGEQTNINNATINYDNNNRDLIYQKINYTPNGNISNNTLNITLRHKIPNLTVVVTNNSGFDKISSVSNAKLGNDYPNATFSLESGKMLDWGNSTMIDLSFMDTGSPTTGFKSSSVFVNNDTSGNDSHFSADIIINGQTKTINLSKAFKIIPEHKSTLTINSYIKCGAYLGPNNTLWKDFMCQNLGATLGIDPFSPEAGNHGAKYQWGTTTGEPDRYLSQYEDQSNPAYNNWSQTVKPNGSWSDTSKTQNDPCPPGYRVPTIAQWGALLENNPNMERIGTFNDDNNNYTTAIYFRNENNIRTLMLPIAGWRFGASGHLIDRGNTGYYWSSTEKDNEAVFAMLEKDDVSLKIFTRLSGNSVRCIAQ